MRSEAHDALADRALRWLENRATFSGIRGAREVTLGREYVADAVALCGLQCRFHEQVCRDAGEKPLRVYATTSGPSRVESGIPCEYCVVFEAKATRADFLGTFGPNAKAEHANRRVFVGHLHYVVTEPGICQPEEVPDFWGHLERRGAGLSVRKRPRWMPMERSALLDVAYQILWKRPRMREATAKERRLQAEVNRLRLIRGELVGAGDPS